MLIPKKVMKATMQKSISEHEGHRDDQDESA